jgi:hypothetical protein
MGWSVGCTPSMSGSWNIAASKVVIDYDRYRTPSGGYRVLTKHVHILIAPRWRPRRRAVETAAKALVGNHPKKTSEVSADQHRQATSEV